MGIIFFPAWSMCGFRNPYMASAVPKIERGFKNIRTTSCYGSYKKEIRKNKTLRKAWVQNL